MEQGHNKEAAMRQAAISLLSPPGENSILLGLNNQGRHKGRIIPPSETVEPGETPLQTAYRGIMEEVLGVTIVGELRQVGDFPIHFKGWSERNIELFVFRGKIVGEPHACRNEFSWLRFFRPENINVDKMWPDAWYWFPHVLALGLDDGVLKLPLFLPAEPRFGKVVGEPCACKHGFSWLRQPPSALEVYAAAV